MSERHNPGSGGERPVAADGQCDVFGDTTLGEVARAAAGDRSQEERAEAVALVFAAHGLTCAVRWWEDDRPITLAAAGAALAAVLAPEPPAVLALVRRGEPVVLDDLALTVNPTAAQETWQRLLLAAAVESALLVPLLSGDAVVGVLSLFASQQRPWPAPASPRLALLGRVAGSTLAAGSATAAAELRRIGVSDEGEEAYRGAVEALHTNRDAVDACRRAALELSRLLDAEWSLVARTDAGRRTFDCHLPVERWSYTAEETPLLAQVVGTGRSIENADFAEDALVQRMRQAGVVRSLAVPVQFQDEILGALVVGFTRPDGLTPQSRRLIDRLAFHIALALRDAAVLLDREETVTQLRHAQHELTENAKFRALAQMAGGVAHEFNNALGGILGRAQMLQRQTKDPRIQKELRTIFEIGWRAAETVRRLQEFTRERSEEDFRPVRVEDLWEQLCAMARQRVAEFAEASPARYYVELERGELSGVVLANPDDLCEAVGNVLTNALEATPGGGVVMMHGHSVSDHLYLTIVDRGRGMTEDEQQSIFDPFYSSKAETGVGLGLSVTYGIISRHRGEIEVESAPNVGTTVSITVPLSTGMHAEPETGTPGLARHILVIDDEAALCDVLAELFTTSGYTVDTCAGGREGIDRFQNTHYDLVCTDLRTLDVSGWEVIRAVKESGRSTPVMLLTGFRDQLRQEQIEESGVDAVLGKPFTLQQVLESAESLLHGHG